MTPRRSVPAGAVRAGAAAAAAAALLAAGCGPEAGTEAGVTVRDSAGVEIVENRGDGAWPDGAAWTLSDAPVLDLGSVSGPDRLFRVEDATRLSDGRVVVANAGTAQLLVFAPDGRLLRSLGGEGQGPGEFTGKGRGLSDVTRGAGDTLRAFDVWNRRVSVFHPREGFVRSVELVPPEDSPAGLVSPAGWLADGRFVGRTLVPGDRGPELEGRRRRSRERLVLFGRDGGLRDTLGVFPGRETRVLASGVDRSGGTFDVRAGEVPFRLDLAVHAGEDRIAVAPTERYQVRLYDREGDLVRLVRRPDAERRPVTARQREAWIEARLAEADDPAERRRARRELEGLSYPERMPALSRVVLDAGDRLWVREHRPPTASGPAPWSVYDRRGRLLGRVAVPAALEPYEIGDGYVLGLHEDELDVEHVRLYELRKPGAGDDR